MVKLPSKSHFPAGQSQEFAGIEKLDLDPGCQATGKEGANLS